MDAHRFDRLSEYVGATASRRAALAALIGGLAQIGIAAEARGKGNDKHNKRKRRRRRRARRVERLACTQCTATQVCDEGTCRTCDVCASGCAHNTIQAAVDAAAAGATLAICAGTYSGGPINIAKNLTLVGAGSDENGTTLTGEFDKGDFAHVQILPNAVVTLRDLAIVRRFKVFEDQGRGGGLFVAAGATATLTRVLVAVNQTPMGSGVWNLGSLILETGTLVTRNLSEGACGGICNFGWLTRKPGSAIYGNTPDNCVDLEGGQGCR